jgi:phage gp16-like protein
MVVNAGQLVCNRNTNTTLSALGIEAFSLERSVSTTAFGSIILRHNYEVRLRKSVKQMQIDAHKS